MLWAVALHCPAAAPTTGKARLRELAALPSANIDFSWDLDSSGFTEADDVFENPGVTNLLKAMDGTREDAGRYKQLYWVYRDNFETNQANDALAHSIALYRKIIAAEPTNVAILLEFGSTLGDSPGGQSEAEHVLRQSVELASNDWHAWDALGGFLLNRCPRLMFDKSVPGWATDSINDLLNREQPTLAHLAEARSALAEGLQCCDQAVALAPREPKAYQFRAAARSSRAELDSLVKSASGEEMAAGARAREMVSPDVMEDVDEVVRLDPRNYRAIAFSAFARTSLPLLQSGQDAPTLGEAPPSASSRDILLPYLAALHKLADDPDPKVVGGALEAEGLFQMLLSDPASAAKSFRQALAADPARERAARSLAYLLTTSLKDKEGAATALENLVKYKPTPENRYFLAKCHEKADRLDLARSDLDAILAIKPDDIDALLGTAALLLKHTYDASLLQAATHLAAASNALAKLPLNKENSAKAVNYLFLAGLYEGLIGHTDQARAAFRSVLDRDPTFDSARDALKALDN
jgi:tetratricopeptide (TPR) repeat protein